MEPHEVLSSVYHSLPVEKGTDDSSTEKEQFRLAIADLLLEPATFTREPEIYRELLRIGATIGANEVVESLLTLVTTNNLPAVIRKRDPDGVEAAYDLFRECLDAVKQGMFSNAATLRFYQELADRMLQNYRSAPEILESLIRLDPENWTAYVNSSAVALNNYHRSRYLDPDFDVSMLQLRRDLIAAVGPTRFQRECQNLEIGDGEDTLNWLLPKSQPTDEPQQPGRSEIMPRAGSVNLRRPLMQKLRNAPKQMRRLLRIPVTEKISHGQ